MTTIGITDTTFAGIDLAKHTLPLLKQHLPTATLYHVTVPGIKDLPVACKKLIEEHHCDLVLALGMVGPEPIDKQCGHEASLGIQLAKLLTNTHILEVFIHYDERPTPQELLTLAQDRAEKHAMNAVALLTNPDALHAQRGKGLRQGSTHAGALR